MDRKEKERIASFWVRLYQRVALVYFLVGLLGFINAILEIAFSIDSPLGFGICLWLKSSFYGDGDNTLLMMGVAALAVVFGALIFILSELAIKGKMWAIIAVDALYLADFIVLCCLYGQSTCWLLALIIHAIFLSSGIAALVLFFLTTNKLRGLNKA